MTNDGNPLEELLRTWTPRRPSPRVKARLFPIATPAPEAPLPGIAPHFRWEWLAPATLAMLLALVTLEHGPTELTPALIPSLALAQPQLSTYMTMHSPHNALALNDTSFSSTAAHPAPSTPSSQFGTNTVSP